MKRLSGVLLAFLLALPMAHAADDADIPPPEKAAGVDMRDPAVIEKGMAMLSSTCGGYCHGTEGRGFKGPSLRNRTDLSVDSLYAVIVHGRKRAGKLMPGWKGVLPDQDIYTAIAAIVSLRHVPPEEGKGGSH
jgi:hypothetical protein